MKQVAIHLPSLPPILCYIEDKKVWVETAKLSRVFPAVELPQKLLDRDFVRLSKIRERFVNFPGTNEKEVVAFCDRIYKQLRRIHKHLEDGNEVVTVNGLLVRTHPDSPHLVSLTDIHKAAKPLFVTNFLEGGGNSPL